MIFSFSPNCVSLDFKIMKDWNQLKFPASYANCLGNVFLLNNSNICQAKVNLQQIYNLLRSHYKIIIFLQFSNNNWILLISFLLEDKRKKIKIKIEIHLLESWTNAINHPCNKCNMQRKGCFAWQVKCNAYKSI